MSKEAFTLSAPILVGGCMAKSDYEGIKKVLQEFERNKFVRFLSEQWSEQAKLQAQATLLIVLAVLGTIVILNWWGKLTPESNGWIIAALIGYLFGRGQK